MPPRPSVAGYEILGELGRGGMGVVFKARHLALQRIVALKMILTGEYASAAELARFRAEALAVAKLQHPNIVQIYEVGEQGGRPFFALEYVAGGSLAQATAGAPQPPRIAAQLIATLARAVDFAHQHGIIHRDLKPANILLASPEPRGESRGLQTGAGLSTLASSLSGPKITDFGLAKYTGDDAAQTKTGTAIGTPSYIAPEQAAARKDIGPAVDIYSLGAILYELLTGRPPFRGESPMGTMLQVMSEEPVPPSRLQPKVPRDLETICLKCLEKDPVRRYPTALALADDLARFQDAKPIAARPVGLAGRAQRWARRNPVIAGLSAALLLALMVGFFAVTILWQRAEANFADAQRLRKEVEGNLAEAKKQRDRAEESLKEADRQRQRAEENFRQARKAVDEFYTKVSESRLLNVPGLQPLRKELMEAALKYYQKFAEEHANDPAVQNDLALAYIRLASLHTALGARPKALETYKHACELCRQQLQLRPDDAEMAFSLAMALNNQSALHLEGGQFAEAQRCFQEANSIWEKLSRQHTGKLDYQQALAYSTENLGHVQAATGQIAEAFRLLEQSRGLREKLVQAQPSSADAAFNLTRSHHHIGYLQYETGQLGSALQNLQKARATRQALAAQFPGSADMQNELGRTLTSLGELHSAAGRAAEAQQAFDQARDVRSKVARDNPGVNRLQRDLAHTLYRNGRGQRATGKLAEALASFQQAREIQEKVAAATGAANELGRTLSEIAALEREAGKPAEALPLAQRARDILEVLVKTNPDYQDQHSELAGALLEQGRALDQLGRRPEAVSALRAAVDRARGPFDKAPQVVEYRRVLGDAYSSLGRMLRDTGKTGEAAGAFAERRKLYPTQPMELYGVARALSLTAAAVGMGKSNLSSAEQAERRRIADHAMDALHAAVQHGFKDADQLKKDPDLALLRERADFPQLLAKLEKGRSSGLVD